MHQTVSQFLRGTLIAAVAGLPLLAAAPVAQAQAPQRNTAMIEARKRVTEAQAIVNEIKKEETRLKEKRRADFETKEEWKDTVADHKKAKAAYEKARMESLAAVKKSEKYKTAVKNRDALATKMEELQKKPGVEPAAIAKTGTQLANEGMAIKKMETEALERDDKVLEAKDTFDAAQKELDELDQEVEAALQADPDYAAVKQQLDQADLQLVQAREAAEQMRKSEADARRAARPVRAPKAPRRGGAEGME